MYGGFERLLVPVTAGPAFDGHDFAIRALCHGVGNSMAAVSQDVGKVILQQGTSVDSQRIQRELWFVPQYDLLTGWRETVREMRQAGEDDFHSLPISIRFTGHSLAAIISIAALGYWHIVSFPAIGQVHLGLLGLPLTFYWIIGLTNAYNFMDGIDGIAAGQATVAGLWWSVYGWTYNQPFLIVLSLLLTCSSIGFLAHNWPPARIFLGDVGSAFLGYIFSILPLMASFSSSTDKGWNGSLLFGILINWPFLLDTTYTFLRRMFNRDNVFCAHRSHIYQRLVIAGYSSGFVSLLYMGLSVIGGVIALYCTTYNINS